MNCDGSNYIYIKANIKFKLCNNLYFKVNFCLLEKLNSEYYYYCIKCLISLDKMNLCTRNLLKNPFGDENFDHWISCDDLDHKTDFRSLIDYYTTYCEQLERCNPTNQFSDQWMNIERSPDGLNDQILIQNVPVGAFVTSFKKGKRYQMIDLYNECLEDGKYKLTHLLNDLFMHQLTPKIEIKENYAARNDCGSIYGLKCFLVNSDYKVVDKFFFEDKMSKLGNAKWKEVQHVFNLKEAVRYLIFYHSGVDTQHWAGFYGSKMTNGSVKIFI